MDLASVFDVCITERAPDDRAIDNHDESLQRDDIGSLGPAELHGASQAAGQRTDRAQQPGVRNLSEDCTTPGLSQNIDQPYIILVRIDAARAGGAGTTRRQFAITRLHADACTDHTDAAAKDSLEKIAPFHTPPPFTRQYSMRVLHPDVVLN